MPCPSFRLSYVSVNVVLNQINPEQSLWLNVSLFLDEFSSLLERLVTTSCPLIIAGVFNFHLDDERDRAAARFQDLLI